MWPSRFDWSSLVATLLLLFSLFQLAVASPLPDDHNNSTLVARARPDFPKSLPGITKQSYETYLRRYFPQTDRYLFYSAGADKKQIPRFLRENDYLYYGNMINAPVWKNPKDPPPNHPWYRAFDMNKVQDDGEAASKAMANVATGTILVFGAIDYKNYENSYFSSKEIKRLHKGIRSGRITAIHHMAKGAMSPDEVMAIEDENGNIVWQPGYTKGTENASVDCDGKNNDSPHPSDEETDDNSNNNVEKRSLGYGRCGPPKINRKGNPQQCSATNGKGKRALNSKQDGGACPLKQPTCTAAMEKVGKCASKKCTVAMKKAGKCGTTKKCTVAMKKAGKCGTTTKCTVAMKKAGKCGTKKNSSKTGKHTTKKRPSSNGKKTGKHTTKKRPASQGKKTTRKQTKRPSRAGRKTSRKGRGRGRH